MASAPVATVVTVLPIATVVVPVVVPADAKRGQVISVQGPSGPMSVVVPMGVKAGETFNIVASETKPMKGLAGIAQLIGDEKNIEVNQKVSILEAASLGCCEQQNMYQFKLGGKDGNHVLTAREKSDGCSRVCCKPHHSLLLHVFPAYDESNTLLTVERQGCNCSKLCFSPKPYLGCFTCMEMCTEEVTIHEGFVDGEPGEIESSNAVMKITQPMQCCDYSSGCTPTLNLSKPGEDTPSAIVTGPMCFGGWSELCCESDFKYATADGGDIASIKHLTPRNFGEACKFLCTDSDNFGIEFQDNAPVIDKAGALMSALVVDYMFFEIDNGLCYCEDDTLYITCCLCFCWGTLNKCNCCIKFRNPLGGAPVAPENMVGAPSAPDVAVEMSAVTAATDMARA